MEKFIFALFWLLFLPVSYSQTTFSKIISNYPLDPENAWTVAEADDGYIMVSVGECLGQDIIVCGVISKLNDQGDIVWFKQFDFYPHILSSLAIRDNKIYVSGSSNQGEDQFVFYCLDMDGNIIWDRKYGDPTQEDVTPSFAFTQDNHIILCGTRQPNIAGMPLQMAYLVKIDLDGNVMDEHIYDFQNNQTLSRTVIQTTDLQTVFSYSACPSSCFLEVTGGVASVDTIGNLNWNVAFPFSFVPDRPNIIQTDASTLVANWHSETTLPNHVLNPPTLFYLNLSGQTQDQYVFENQSYKSITDLEPDLNKGIIGCGSNYIDYLTSSNPVPGGWVFRMGEGINLLWERTYTDTTYQGRTGGLQSITRTRDGGYIAVGYVINKMTGVLESHNWIIKLDSLGCLQEGCGETNYITESTAPTFIKGLGIKIFPNPASDFINIEFPNDAGFKNVIVSILSGNGTLVGQDSAIDAKHEINISALKAGPYFIVVSKDNEILCSKRIIVVK